jgi:hypothetical protein
MSPKSTQPCVTLRVTSAQKRVTPAPQRGLENLMQPKTSHVNPKMSHDVTHARVTLYRSSAATDGDFSPRVTQSHVLQTKGSRVYRLRTHGCVRVLARSGARMTITLKTV